MYHYFIALATILVTVSEDMMLGFYTLLFPNLLIDTDIADKKMTEIQQIVGSVFPAENERFNQYLCGLIYTLLQSEAKEQLLVYLQMNQTLTGNYHLKSKLHQTFSHETLQITEKPEKADLIITDWFEALHPSVPTLYFDPNQENESWIELVKSIQELAMKKKL
ncbi:MULTISPECIES: hypothetical protein [unclassified Enterococcus]|uniref:hypothetical protein n=1 Tax=unclassified Enterococcus TaxID=2608891 RepID=UPI0013ECB2B1|nr:MULTISPECIES: hypothetical protein [unclassified Enterococcus]